MDFLELERLFLDYLRHRVRRGDFSERRLAHLTGISQPHIHNILSGKRSLSLETADLILHTLHIDILDLLNPEDRAGPSSRD